MRVKAWLASSVVMLLASAVSAAASGELLIDAARRGDRDAVRSLIAQRVDVNHRQRDGTTALAWAALRNDTETVDLLVRAGADVDMANDLGVTPLSLACTNRNGGMAERLLQASANPNIAQWSGETPLMTCARTGSVEGVVALVAKGANIDAQTRRGQTALMWAVAQKRPQIARVLIGRGANVDLASRRLPGFEPAQYLTFGLTEFIDTRPGESHEDPETSKGGFTALMFAALVGDVESARILVSAGAKVNHVSSAYGNAVTVAALSGHEAVASFLLENDVDPDVPDLWGFRPLHYALREGITAIGMARARVPSDRLWLRRNLPQLVTALLARGANPNVGVGTGHPPYNYLPFARTDNGVMPYLRQSGATPFLLAAASMDADVMRALVKAGADPLRATDEGATPLMVAAGLGKLEPLTNEEEARALEAVKLAAELGADVNAATQDGRTALMGAAHIGANTIVAFLAARGANLNAIDKYGQTAIGAALGTPAPDRNARRNRRTFRRSTGQTGAEIVSHTSTAELLVRLGATPPAASSRR